jgi:hypothetical protein
MQRLARAAVSQLIFYAEGECAPRPSLLHELERWQRLHSMLATHICPTRRHASLNDANLSAVQALIPEAQFDALREIIRQCGECGAGDACPLEREPQLELFGEW